ncbi:rCG44998, partial [Rattus norvegicus]
MHIHLRFPRRDQRAVADEPGHKRRQSALYLYRLEV